MPRQVSYLIFLILPDFLILSDFELIFISKKQIKMSGKPTDDQLRQAIDAIFNKYDTDHSGTLEQNEIFQLINDAFKSLGRNR